MEVKERQAKKAGSGNKTEGGNLETRRKFRLRIVYNRKACIGSSHCILSDPYNFELDEGFKAVLKGGKEMPNAKGVFVKVIETEEPHLAINAAKTCTPRVISIIDLDTGKRIAP
jgi:ferredoxin